MMRDLAISYGNSRQAKKWVNKTISFDALKERLKTTIRTTESTEEYAKMSKAQRDAAKDHGGFVGGTLKGGRRKIDTVELRSMIALDGDRIDKAFLDNYETNAPYTSVLYTTHSSTEDSPRVRIIFPMTRDVSSEEFVAVSRYVAQALGIDFFDECSYQPNQLMYWPSTPQNGVFVYKETDKEWLDPDAILSAHPEWTDPTRLPTSSRESKANTVTQQKVQDPLSKDGVVGLFNRAFFPVTKALEAFLSDIYEPTDNPNRWHLIESRSIAGVEIKEDRFVYSHHAKDPAYLKLCNAFDIVRIHKFGDDDDKASFRAMCDFAMQQEDVKLLAANERLAEAEADFTAGDDDWKKRLKYQPRTSLLENSVYNLNLILANDPDFRNFAFNDMANRIQVTGPLPWERPKGNQFWRDADTAQLKSIIDIRYLPFSSRNHDVAFTKAADDRHFHPVRDYLDSLPAWDGVKRVDTLFIKYLKADDTEYVRAVTRKTFAAAVARIYVPGIKFDCVPVLDGDQGIRRGRKRRGASMRISGRSSGRKQRRYGSPARRFIWRATSLMTRKRRSAALWRRTSASASSRSTSTRRCRTAGTIWICTPAGAISTARSSALQNTRERQSARRSAMRRYEIDTYTVDRDGTLSFSDRNDTEEVERLIGAIVSWASLSLLISNLTSGLSRHTYKTVCKSYYTRI